MKCMSDALPSAADVLASATIPLHELIRDTLCYQLTKTERQRWEEAIFEEDTLNVPPERWGRDQWMKAKTLVRQQRDLSIDDPISWELFDFWVGVLEETTSTEALRIEDCLRRRKDSKISSDAIDSFVTQLSELTIKEYRDPSAGVRFGISDNMSFSAGATKTLFQQFGPAHKRRAEEEDLRLGVEKGIRALMKP